jgi:ATP adenylyltransferase
LLSNWAGRSVEAADLVSRLGGLPLALKLSGAQLSDQVPLDELRQHLHSPSADLQQLDLDQPQDPQESLILCFDFSYNRLPERHVLIVTRAFEDQQERLGPADFAALWTCLEETDGLGFLNAGEAAGASQRHKHLQVVPLPQGPGGAFPLAARLEALAPREGVALPSDLPFPAALASVEALGRCGPDAAAAALLALYREMLRRTGVVPGRVPYNLLATRRWLWLVPRSRPEWQGIAVNALGFAGALLVPDDAALDRLRAIGPLSVLRAVTPEAGRV